MATTSVQARVFEDPLQPLAIDSGEGHLRVQLCLSPLCSTIASLIEVSATGWDGPADGWRSIVERSRVDPDCGPLSLYTRYPAIPRFLLPRLHDPAPDFGSQLADICHTTDAEIRQDLSDAFGPEPPAAYLPFVNQPRVALSSTAEALAAYHRAVIAPRWSAMRQVLSRDVLRLAYLIVTLGPESSLNRVHPAIAYADGLIQVGAADDQAGTPAGLGDRVLMLTPLVCDPQGLLADLGDRSTVKIGYAAPAARSVWSSRPEPGLAPWRRLSELLGERRAVILASLDGPSTTTALSQVLLLAPSTVSEHIRHLCQLGLATGTRSGRHVYYTRTGTGDGLLDLFS